MKKTLGSIVRPSDCLSFTDKYRKKKQEFVRSAVQEQQAAGTDGIVKGTGKKTVKTRFPIM